MKEEIINLRIKKKDKLFLANTAKELGISLSSFIVKSAMTEAITATEDNMIKFLKKNKLGNLAKLIKNIKPL